MTLSPVPNIRDSVFYYCGAFCERFGGQWKGDSCEPRLVFQMLEPLERIPDTTANGFLDFPFVTSISTFLLFVFMPKASAAECLIGDVDIDSVSKVGVRFHREPFDCPESFRPLSQSKAKTMSLRETFTRPVLPGRPHR